jgi:hypothetical protein
MSFLKKEKTQKKKIIIEDYHQGEQKSMALTKVQAVHSFNYICKISAIITGNFVLCFHNKKFTKNQQNYHALP